MNDKIRPNHLERMAYVYIRQSTLHQVRNHQESRRRQYDLQIRARELGFRQVEVIDEDLGVSGTGSKEHPGFGRLLAAVCEGRVGAVLALEASRLARNNRDWHHLIDLCVMTDALVIDADGVYDPRVLNDRLLLGLKGTMSEFELGLLRQRAQEAFRQKIARGEVLFEVPIGYLQTERNGLELSPDRQVQEAIRGVFGQFERLGSIRQVLLWYRQEKIPLCTYSRSSTEGRQLAWKLPGYSRLWAILTNPTYAGAFAYGRNRTRSHMVDGRARKTAGHGVPQEQWAVLIRDHHEPYIKWEQFERNQQQLMNNAPKYHGSAKGAAKRGPALLAGLLRCARCGRKLHVAYGGASGRVVRYDCRGGNLNHGVEPCLAFGGLRVDEAVTEAVLSALEPLGVQAALEAWDHSRQNEDHKTRSLQLALDKARYEADRIRRQYDAVDPANRLVAGELESRWNLALEAVDEARKRVEATHVAKPTVSEAERARLLQLGADLRSVWEHPATDLRLKKRTLRALLEEIVADIDETANEISCKVHWVGGVHTTLRIPKNIRGGHRRCTDRDVVELIRELVLVSTDASIASILNRLGYRTGAGNTWTESRVLQVRRERDIPGHQTIQPRSWVTLAEAASELKVAAGAVRTLLEQAILPARQVIKNAPWVIRREDLLLPSVQEYVKAVRTGKRVPRQDNGQSMLHL